MSTNEGNSRSRRGPSQASRRAAGWAATGALVLAGSLAPQTLAPQAGAAPAATAAPGVSAATTAAQAPSARARAMRDLRRVLRARATAYAGAAPASPNPSLALFPPGVKPDYQAWAQQASRLSAARVASKAHRRSGALATVPGVTYQENEGPGERGFNDTLATAEPVPGVGTGAGDEPAATLLGTMNPASVPGWAYQSLKPNKENDDGPGRARNLRVSNRYEAVKVPGYRGDAPGRGNRAKDDYDWYRLNLSKGERVTASMARRTGRLKPVLALVDTDFNIIGDTFNQFRNTATLDTSVFDSGTYYLVAFGWWIGGRGPTTGDYLLKAAAPEGDPDTYAVDLSAGDVLSASLDVKGWVDVIGPDGTESHASNQDASFIYPMASPLPGARGRGLSDYVVREDGRYYVQVSGGDGSYVGRLEVYRHGGEGAATPQRIFLDTDGARINTGIWGGRGVVELSPLAKYLPRWGLGASDEAAVVAGIKANVIENVQADLAANGLSGTVDVEVTTSLDGPDISGEPGVTTVIVGGSIGESGVPTIGIAQSIDPGNFERTEKALVLLDVLSGSPDGWGKASLNYYLTDESDRVAFVAQGVGNVTSHEIGHVIGNWHTDNSNGRSNLMDAGGLGFGRLFGVGPDKIGGTADDRDVDFQQDTYDLYEGFRGREDTITRSTFAMSS